MSTTFRSLKVRGWRQFASLELDFHPSATILTGANGSGKTTVLGLLAKHFAWPRTFYGLSFRRPDGTFGFFLSYEREEQWANIGTLEYTNGQRASLQIPTIAPSGVTAAYDVAIQGQQSFPGVYLTSHRTAANYTAVSTIPASFSTPKQLFSQLLQEIRNRHAGQRSMKSPFAWMKESLIAAAIYGEGSASVEPDPVAHHVWKSFQQVLRNILPESLEFQRLVVRAPEVIVETSAGAFPIDESSGGVSALMELGWQILLQSIDEDGFVVLFDEPENHLHPELQRQIVPNLLRAFPNIQFIIATHSPFVVTSVAESNVYVLDYEADGGVVSRLLDRANKAASAEETLQRVLGLESTMPAWAETAFAQVLERHLSGTISAATLDALRRDLQGLGLESSFPTVVADALKRSERAQDT